MSTYTMLNFLFRNRIHAMELLSVDYQSHLKIKIKIKSKGLFLMRALTVILPSSPFGNVN